jgi:hypothetical protein
VVNAGVAGAGEHETLSAAARHMREHDIGVLAGRLTATMAMT